MNIGEILVRFGADIGGFMSGIRTATGALGSFGAAVVAASAIVAALAVIIGVVSVKAAADFQQGLNRLVTGAGDVTDNMGRMGQSILATSTATGVLTGQLLPAMYQIISAGQRGAQAQDTLRVAAMGSVTEQAKIVDVAKAITTAMTDYGTSQFNATQFMNGYTRATQLGKLTLEELSTSMGPILPLAKNIGISFADVAGAMSTMTNAGIPAERAATSLRFLMQSLENPTHKATVAMESMGLSSVAVGNELKVSLPGALEMIYKAALRAGPEGSVPFNRAVSDMIGGQRSLQAYLSLTGSHFATYQADVKAITAAMNFSKTAVLGWDTAQQNFNVQLNIAKAYLAAVAIAIGTQLLPVLGQILAQLPALINDFSQAAAWFRQFAPQVALVGVAFANLGAALAPSVARMQQAGTAGGLLATALSLLRGIILGLLAGITALVNGIASVIQWFNAGGPVVQRLYTMFQQLGAIITGAFIPAWRSMQQSFADVMTALRPIMPQLQLLAQILGGIVVASIIIVISVLVGLITAFAGVLAGITRIVAGIIQIFAGLVTSITGYINLMTDLFTGRFDRLGADLDQIMQGIVQMFIGAWNVIAGLFQAVYGLIVGFTSGFVSSLEALFNGLFQTLVGGSIVPDMCNAIVAAFTGMIAAVLSLVSSFIASAISLFISLGANATIAVINAANQIIAAFNNMRAQALGSLQSLVSGAAGILNQLAGIAARAGSAMISALVGQINAGVGWVGAAVNNVVSTIRNLLPGSPAKEGPLRDLPKFGPGLTHGFAEGIIKGAPEVKAAVTMMLQPFSRPPTSHVGVNTPGGYATGPSSSTQGNSRPIIIQVGNREYRGFVQNLGRDLQGTIVIQKGGLR